MGIYSDEVEKILLKAPMLENPLFKYDNYTYHIQLFMVDKETLENYNRTRWKTLSDGGIIDTSTKDAAEAYNLLNDSNAIKVVIAESGVTDVISINELIIKSVPAYGNEKVYAASTEFKLKITETAGNGLVNKMHLLAGLLGYQSYISTPVFISIWFTGYNNTNGEKPVDKIIEGGDAPIALPIYTYQLIISQVDTTMEDGKTVYDMTLYPTADTGLQTDFSYMNNTAFSKFGAGEMFPNILKKLEEAKNEELRKLWNFYDAIYKNDKAFEIVRISKNPNSSYEQMLMKDFPELQTEQDLMFLQEMYGYGQAYNNLDRTPSKDQKSYLVNGLNNDKFIIGEKELGIYKSSMDFMTSEENGKRTQRILDNINQKMNTNYKRGLCSPEYLESIIKAQTQLTYGMMPKEDLDNKPEGSWPGGTYKPSTSNNICSIISEIWRICCPKLDYIPAFSFCPKYVGDYQNKSFYKIILYVWIQKYPGLKDMIDGTKYGNYYENIKDKQLNYLFWCFNNFSLLKRYHYLLNGKDTSVLSYNTKEDLFWYLNASNYAIGKSVEQTDNKNNADIKDLEFKSNAEKKLNEYINSVIKDKVKLLREKNNYKETQEINIDDVTEIIDSEGFKIMKGAMYRASQLNDLLIYLQTQKTQDEDKTDNGDKSGEQVVFNDEITNSLIAANNFLTHGQKLQLKLKILGDPYWLGFSSENLPLLNKSLPHLVMCTKTFSRLNENDEHKEDKSMEINTIYSITSIVSTFNEGTFTQELEGAVPPPFVQEDIDNKIVISNENSLKSSNILTLSNGSVLKIDSQENLGILNKDSLIKDASTGVDFYKSKIIQSPEPPKMIDTQQLTVSKDKLV